MGIKSLFQKKKKNTADIESDDATLAAGREEQREFAGNLYAEISRISVSLDWYRRTFPLLVKFGILITILAIFLLATNVALYMAEQEPRYYSVTPDFRVKELVPLTEPLVTQGGLIDWLTRTTGDSLSINFLDWRKQLFAARPNFSEKGYNEFLLALKKSQLLDLIKEKRLSSQVMITKTPVIVGQGIIPQTQKMAWKIEFGVKMMLESSNGREYEDEMMATVVIQRANTMTKPQGLEIRQFVLD